MRQGAGRKERQRLGKLSARFLLMAQRRMTTKKTSTEQETEEVTLIDELALHAARNVARALRAGRCPMDCAFDRFLPADLRRVSDEHWTPLVAALRAAQWLDEAGVRTVVDIGSGAGKFCVAAALAGHCRFKGLEHRRRLVRA